jgi:hypothetical protein
MRSIATSVFVPSKTKWEENLQSYLGQDYLNISSFSLAGTHISVFVHLSLSPIISNISSDCVATGI